MIRLNDADWALLKEMAGGLSLETLTRQEYRQLIGQMEEAILELRQKAEALARLREKIKVAYQLREQLSHEAEEQRAPR